ncbi:olfactory receptor 4E2-like [Ambystoma mexicanum]|uniref:olfactory receptor 4E2-like n=1 Tax=Ambystoma mexicanum TaxID=8296 RepID=UPI0037E7A123
MWLHREFSIECEADLVTLTMKHQSITLNTVFELKNRTQVKEFFLLGMSDDFEVQVLLLLIFSVFFLVTMVGNALIISIIVLCSRLHNPMYFFLCNLSFLDICYSSVTVPKMLSNLLAERKTISFYGCIAQMYFFHVLGSAEMFLLAVMAYDRYVAICNPLRYPTIMSWKASAQLAAAAWLGGFTHSTLHTALILRLSFCGPNLIEHFFCDATPLLVLSCSDTSVDEVLILTTPGVLGPSCFLLILVSYCYIISSILKIRSAEGRKKTFSTCASHVMVVSVFYGTGVFVYIQPMSVYSAANNSFITVFYAVITPMLNPIIYALRNKDVKGAMKTVLCKKRTIVGKTEIVNIF